MQMYYIGFLADLIGGTPWALTDGTPSGTPSTPDLPGIGPRNLNLPQSASIYLPLHLFSLLFSTADAKMQTRNCDWTPAQKTSHRPASLLQRWPETIDS